MTLKSMLALLAIAAVMPLAACGDDEVSAGGGGDETTESAESGQLAMTASSDAVIAVDGDAQAGVVAITLQNDGKEPASAQLIRVEGNHSEQEVKRALAEASKGGPIPGWFRAEGGPGTTNPGSSSTVTQELPAGTYYAINDEPDEPTFTSFEVADDGDGGELPETTGTITALDEGRRNYSFEAEGLTAGRNTVLFENEGQQPHHVLALPMNEGATIEDVRRFVKTEKGRPPVDFAGGSYTSVIDGEGKSMAVDLELKQGDYALVCFISDREGGPPHAVKGMVSEATVE